MKFLNGQLILDGSITGTTGLFTGDIIVNGLTTGKGPGSVSFNTVFGFNALSGNTSGNYNVAIGVESLFNNTTGRNNISIGVATLYSNTTGRNNTAIGDNVLGNNTTGGFNTSVGYSSLASNLSGFDNVAVGGASLYGNTSGELNVGLGANTLYFNQTGSNNIAIGYYALKLTNASNNIAIGYEAGDSNTTGTNNIFIGYQADGVDATQSGRTWIGNSATTSTWLAGNVLIGTTTDSGYKLNVNGTAKLGGTTLIEGPLTVNFGNVVGGTSIVANGNTIHNGGRGIYTTGYAYGIQANQTMVGNWSNQPDAAGVHGTGEIGVYGSGGIAGFSGPSAFFTSLLGNSRVSARNYTSTVQVRGTGTTFASTALLVENSSGEPIMVVNNGGSVLVGTNTNNNSRLLIGGTVSGATLNTTRATHINAALLATGSTTTLIGLDIQPTFTPGSFTGLTQLALRVSGGTQIIGSGSTGTTLSVFSVDGASGRLFDVSDDLSSTLFSVNTIAGLPVIEAYATSAVVMGKYGQNALVVSGTSVGVGTSSPQAKLHVNGTMLLGNLSGDPAGSNGMLYYNTTTNKFRGYENGAWADLI
jgi:hypothetical protein